jgi:hypothetical protein
MRLGSARPTDASAPDRRSGGGKALRVSGLPSCPQHEVVPDPARLERAATLTDCGLGLVLTG